jgi:hypothetical protein
VSTGGTFEIVFEPGVARRVSRYVARGFFGPRELPQALARMVLTREFGIMVGIGVIPAITISCISSCGPHGRLPSVPSVIRTPSAFSRARLRAWIPLETS